MSLLQCPAVNWDLTRVGYERRRQTVIDATGQTLEQIRQKIRY
ncbi:MAG TPA: hypothetical protein VFY66_17070 [Anaerolineales bacterium]|nr:hypothetical protein [Anaerolineales bacterium]